MKLSTILLAIATACAVQVLGAQTLEFGTALQMEGGAGVVFVIPVAPTGSAPHLFPNPPLISPLVYGVLVAVTTTTPAPEHEQLTAMVLLETDDGKLQQCTVASYTVNPPNIIQGQPLWLGVFTERPVIRVRGLRVTVGSSGTWGVQIPAEASSHCTLVTPLLP